MATRNIKQVSENSQEIGYLHGKIEMLEKKFDEHRAESKAFDEEVLAKLDEIAKTTSFWRHTLWLFKVIVLSIPLIAAGNLPQLLELWSS